MGLFNMGFDAEKYNLLNENNQLVPNYDLSKKEVAIELYFSPDMEICIIGQIDNNYIAWCSITKLSDEEINVKIFDYIANNELKMVSSDFRVLGNENYNKVSNWYRARISRSTLPNRCWDTPFWYNYGNDKQFHGRNFSKDIQMLFNDLLKKCELRISGGSYLSILKNYFSILLQDSDYEYYNKMKPLISILEAESYLRLCQNREIRECYVDCLDACRGLYNRYMSVVR